MSAFWSLVQRDLVLAWRQGGGVGTALGFFLTVIVMLPIGIGPDSAFLSRMGPGCLWITLLLAVLLSSDRLFVEDYEDGSLDAMAMAPLPLELMVLAKALCHWLTTSLPLALLAPFMGFFLSIDASLLWPLLGSMVLGSIALSMLASIGAAVTVGLRRGGLLVSILVLPLYVPVLIFGMSATTAARIAPETLGPSFLILAAIALTSVVLAPLAAAAALKAYLQ